MTHPQSAGVHLKHHESIEVEQIDQNMKVYGEEHDVQSPMFRPTITDMQDSYCGDCYDICLIQSKFGRHHKKGGAAFGRGPSFMVSLVLALNKVNIVAVTTILVLHVGNGRSEHV